MAYADDIVLLLKTCEIGELLQELYQQCDLIGMEINKQKTQMIRINQVHGGNEKMPKAIGNIKVVEEYKYLGIIINSKGAIKPHMETLKKKLENI